MGGRRAVESAQGGADPGAVAGVSWARIRMSHIDPYLFSISPKRSAHWVKEDAGFRGLFMPV